ncbi:methyltransferase [Arthrobacter sp. ATA002]|uniref:DUF7059 domain-containing protein n=1 Tax=Arthrobacter sp. ATA002 TaxID=2991715 RepID=UPI0022A790BA|nr:methyltransferase [Arthrobacter sp. ATA002]WAP52374.1 methyltransferase [Arthrobacter sp. ATA002]
MTDFAGVPDAPQSSDLPLLSALAADLAAARYTVDGVADFLGESAAAALGRDQLVPALLRCRDEARQDAPAPVSVLIRLWLAGDDLDAAALDGALPRTGTRSLLALGLLEPVPEAAGDDRRGGPAGLYRAAVDLRPYEIAGAADGDAGSAGSGRDDSAGTGLWVASDLGAHQRPGVLRHDHVLGIGQASLSLAQLTVRRSVDRALDLGAGCGIQAFHLLGHARHVTATDISERALAFTRFNLLLNAGALDLDPQRLQDRVSLRLGSLLEPVAGEQFDLVVSNPPFVITPRRTGEVSEDRFTYRDGGLAGDAVVETLVRSLQEVLVPGGTAQMLGNWEIRRGGGEGQDGRGDRPAGGDVADTGARGTGTGTDIETGTHPGTGAPGAAGWSARIESWLAPETDAWVIQREVLEPAEYAEMWLRDAAENRDRAEYLASYAAYLADFASRGVTAIGFGSLFLRRRTAPEAAPLRRFEEITHPLEQPVGPHLGAAVGRFDWLAARPSLLAEHLEVADDVTEERHARPGAEHPGVILLRQGAGLRRTNLMSTELTGFVSASDGELSVGQIIGALAALLGRPDPDFPRDLEAEVRNLVLDGFLVPASR